MNPLWIHSSHRPGSGEMRKGDIHWMLTSHLEQMRRSQTALWNQLEMSAPMIPLGPIPPWNSPPVVNIRHVPCVQAGIAGRWKLLVSHPLKSWRGGGVQSQKLKVTWMPTCANENFPWHKVTPALFRRFHDHNKHHHIFFEENCSLLLIDSNCEKILICVCMNCGSLSHESHSNVSRQPLCSYVFSTSPLD